MLTKMKDAYDLASQLANLAMKQSVFFCFILSYRILCNLQIGR